MQEISRSCGTTNVCVVRNFSLGGINWEGVIGDSDSEEFLKVVQNNFLKHAVTKPTRGANSFN